MENATVFIIQPLWDDMQLVIGLVCFTHGDVVAIAEEQVNAVSPAWGINHLVS